MSAACHFPQPRHSPQNRSFAMAGALPRRRLVARLWRAVEAEITALEARLGGLSADDPAREEGAKQLGLLARLIRDLVALDQQPMINSAAARNARPRKAAPATAETMDARTTDASFADIDALRAALERRLEALATPEEA
jgi:hypothetical protein